MNTRKLLHLAGIALCTAAFRGCTGGPDVTPLATPLSGAVEVNHHPLEVCQVYYYRCSDWLDAWHGFIEHVMKETLRLWMWCAE